MKTEIPKFLIEMSNQINIQNNRMTADPLFEVRYKQNLVAEEGYNESHFEIISEEGICLYHSVNSDNYNDLAEYLLEDYKGWCYGWCEAEEVKFKKDTFLECFNNNYDHDGWVDLPDDIKKLYMQEIEVTVNSHMTEAGAEAFIKRKQHDYPKLYTYAISLCFCPQMMELRNWIRELTK